MNTDTIFLREGEEDIKMKSFIHDDSEVWFVKPRPCVIVCAGGGYEFLANNREGEPVAIAYFAEGYNTFMVSYSIGPKAVYPRPLVDLSRAIVHVRRNAEKYHIDPSRIYVAGFSAGAHLVAALGTFWHEEWAKSDDDMEYGENRPTAVISSYPVITSDEKYTHRGSFCTILGTNEPTDEQLALYSIEKHVSDKTVPTFVWHTADDTCVPVENALMFASALTRAKVPFELHIYPAGEHGLSLSNEETWMTEPTKFQRRAATWYNDSLEFLKLFNGEE